MSSPSSAARPQLAAWHAMAVFAVGAVLAYTLTPVPRGAPLFMAASLTSAAIVVNAARGRTYRRGAWWLFAAGAAIMAVGNASWVGRRAWVMTSGGDPATLFPTSEDLITLAGIATTAAAIFLLVRTPGRRRSVESLLDIAVLTVAGALLLWHTLIDPVLFHPTLSTTATLVALAHPVFSLALLAILGSLLLTRGRRRLPALFIVAAAGLALLTADYAHIHQVAVAGNTTSRSPGGWLTAQMLLAIAALHPSSRHIGAPRDRPAHPQLSATAITLLWAVAVVTATTVLWVAYPTATEDALYTYRHLAATTVAVLVMGSLVLARLSLTTTSLADALRDRRLLNNQLHHAATHDDLTGLANRREFTRRAAEHRDTGRPAAVVFFDLDHFKQVNDRHGHPVGDELLRIVAERLLSTLRRDAVAARLGGDEFAVLLPDATIDDATVIGQRITDIMALPATLDSGRITATIGASVGVAASTTTDAFDRDLVHDADVAMYASKRAGRSLVTVFDQDVHHEADMRLTLHHDLQHTIDRDQLHLDFQPIVDITTGQLVAAEALLRWHHPTRGRLAPAEFIAAAEHSGDIVNLGQWALEDACRHAAAWNRAAAAAGHPPVPVAVNVSPQQIHAPGFTDTVTATLDATGLDATLLTIEITEGSLLEGLDGATLDTLAAVRDAGVAIALDDFGTGYSSLRYLRELPLDVLKVDQSFVRNLHRSTRDITVAASIVHLAIELGLTTVIEGIESTAELAAVSALGADRVQGRLVSGPVPFATLLRLVSDPPGDVLLEDITAS